MATQAVRAVSCLALAIVAATTGVARSQDRVSLWADDMRSSCSISDSPGIVRVYMFQEGVSQRLAVVFFAPTPPCWTGATWLGDIAAPGVVQGLTSTHVYGIGFNYATCLTPPVYLGYMNFLATGQAAECCVYPILPVTGDPSPFAVDCYYNVHAASSGRAVVRATPACPCPAPLAAEPTTWGRVKSLYR